MTNEYDAILWDIGGVLLDPESIQRGRRLFVTGLSVEFDLKTTEAIRAWDRELGAYFRARDGETFRPAYEGYQQTVEKVVGQPVAVDEWLPLAVQAAHVAFEAGDGAIESLEKLADAGYYLGVISDIDAWESEYLLTILDVRSYFEHVTTSAEVGKTKPAPEVFEAALEKAAVPPERILFVGDRYKNDMVGGARAGLNTVAFGGSAAARASDDESVVDYVIDDLRELLTIVGID
ncbi:HAD family hydrolase [Salinibaculum salinum]|uniref:HAD family hydrolase n=1 Tax=Salinibaculum salinum TaxID=3131996 RepID=UPI0030EF052F